MEIKNEQNISDILDSFVNTIKKDKDVKSALVLIETKDARILQVKGSGTSISESLYELCKGVPSIKHTLKVALFVLENEKPAKATDEANYSAIYPSFPSILHTEGNTGRTALAGQRTSGNEHHHRHDRNCR